MILQIKPEGLDAMLIAQVPALNTTKVIGTNQIISIVDNIYGCDHAFVSTQSTNVGAFNGRIEVPNFDLSFIGSSEKQVVLVRVLECMDRERVLQVYFESYFKLFQIPHNNILV